MKCCMLVAGIFFCGIAATAQNLNQTVTVTNQYAAGMSDYQMKTSPTVIPDSLYSFDLDFKYSGFEIKYRGNDSFNPIHTELDMGTRSYDGHNFRMTAAAGAAFPFKLDIDAVLKSNGRFKLGCYAFNDSFWGYYDRILPYGDNVLYPDASSMRGYDSRTRIGLDGRWDWRKGYLTLDLKYDGVHSKMHETGTRNLYNSLVADGHWRWRSDGCFRMGLDANYSLGGYDGGQVASPLTIMESLYDVDLNLTFAIAKVHLLDIGASFNMADTFSSSDRDALYGGYNVILSPMYWFSGNDRLYFGLGVSLMYSASMAAVDAGTAFTGYPRLKLRWKAVRDYMVVYADSGLDAEVWGIGSNSRKNLFYIPDAQKSIVKTYRSALGLRGNVAGKLHYDVHASYSNVQNAPLYVVTMDGTQGGPLTSIVHEKDFRSVDAGAEFMARAGSFTFTADLLYRYFIDAEKMAALPSWLEAGADLKYAPGRRFWIHAGAVYKSDGRAGEYKVPYYVDLKAGTGFNIRKSFGIFIEGANLLNYSRQDVPLYSRSGFELVAGIRLLY